MSKRLQVVLSEAQFDELRRTAACEGVTLSAWVRRTLQAACRDAPQGDVAAKLGVVRAAAAHGFPTADVDEMLRQIESGHAGGTAS